MLVLDAPSGSCESERPGPCRIAVIGTSGAGKTTFARRTAQCLDIPHVELDALFWEPDWTPAPVEAFRARTAAALSGDVWTTDGNYHKVRDIVWGRADTVVWLDYPLPLVLWRVTTRTLHRCLTGQELWSGNRETWRGAFFDRDGIILYALRTYRRNKRRYREIFQQLEYPHLHIVHLRSPRAGRRWLAQLPSPLRSPRAGMCP